MKRGKDDEKMMGPMFPRLHVNDTEKRGPRAPPRNKMALYEQLSIPSQRFNPGVMPLNPSGEVPAASSNQGSSIEKSYHVPPLPAHLADRSLSHQSDGGNSNISIAQSEPAGKKVGDEDDFRVPVFNHSGTGRNHSSTQISSNSRKLVPFGTTNSIRTLKFQGSGDHHPKHAGSTTGVPLRQDVKKPGEENLEAYVSSRNGPERSNTNVSVQGKIIGSEDKANKSPNQQLRDNAMANLSKLHEDDGCLPHETTAGIQANYSQLGDDVPNQSRETYKGNFPHPESYFSSREDHLNCKKRGIGSDRDKKFWSLQLENGDRSNDVSEASVVDSIRALDVSPDDVVGIIGQRHFWKARRAIVNQQRVFAVQVFELHRLIKVQRLIAGSPHILVEDSAYLGKPASKMSPLENITSECVVTPPEHTAKGKDGSEIPNHKMECSAENAIAKTSTSSVKNVNQPPTTASVASDTKISPWCFNQSMGYQWLVPVMSPSEGLVYKPYKMPGFMGSVCGGCGPFGPIPMTDNFMNAGYGGSVSHYQGMGVPPGALPVGYGYFPPYGMPVINPASGSATDQMNRFAGSGSNGQNGNPPVEKEKIDLQRQTSRSVLTQKSRTNPRLRFPMSKDAEIQGSTGSSPCERAPVIANVRTAEKTDAPPPVTAAPEGAPESHETDQPTKVIKVVPHNARSATASVARIFRSIQEERKHHDSI